MSTDNGVYVFPDALGKSGNGSIDPALLLAMQNNGGFGNGAAMWIVLFLWLMWGRNGMFGNNMGAGPSGVPYLANALNNDSGRELLLQAINGRADAAAQLAQITNSSVQQVQSAINTIQSSIQTVGSQVGMSGLQVQNAIQSGNAALSQQLCQCCCENRLAIANQTNTLQSQMASNAAAAQLQAAQNQAANQLGVCQQTNQLTAQSTANTQRIVDGIAAQNTMITKEFCDLKERDMQDKIDSLTANNALLRSELNNNQQTQTFAGMLAPIQAQLAQIQARQPQVITLPFNQYSVVPNWAATVGADFLGSYWANRATQNSSSSTSGTTATA